MDEWWHTLGELIARHLAQRWQAACGGPKPSAPTQEGADATALRIQENEPKDDADNSAS